MLELKGLTKHYGEKKALQGFSYRFESGIYGLLGPNGSGKSTLMNLLTDNLRRTDGQILFDGREILASKQIGESYRAILGFMPQHIGMYPNYRCDEFLHYIAVLKGIHREHAGVQIDRLLEAMELGDVRKKKIRTLSGGMKQRLGIAQAFLGDPKLVILDEPTAGLDPRQRISVRNFLSASSLDRVILIATHVVSDVESVARRCIFLKNGILAADGSPAKLAQRVRGQVWQIYAEEKRANDLQNAFRVVNIRNDGETLCLRILSESKPAPDALPAEPTLEDAYLDIFGMEV